MLDKPHNVRLHMRQAILGSYNLKDPPRSPNISYSGPQWVPDSLRTAWCPAEALMHYMPDDMPIIYESARRMLELVLPDQRESCEVGIELLLMANRLTPERVLSDARSSVIPSMSREEPQHSHRSRRQGSRSSSSLQDTIDEIIRSYMALMDKLAKENREFRSQFGQTTLQDPAPTPRRSSSASGIAPRNENPSLVSSAAEAKVPKPENRGLLDKVTVARPNASTGLAEPERTIKTPRERVGSVLQVVSLSTPTISREQSCRAVLIREPPNRSSLSNDKLSDEVIHPACALFLASLQRVNPQGGDGLQTLSQESLSSRGSKIARTSSNDLF